MPRRTTDLLDVFRAERPSPGGRPAGDAAPSGPKRTFEGLFLVPRQLLLGSCVVVLLLVFAFVLGLSVGRRGTPPPSNALQGNTPRTTRPAEVGHYVVGRVPYVDAARQARIAPAVLRDRLVENYGVPTERIWVRDDADGKQWRLYIGPFASQQQAMEFLMKHTLIKAKLGPGYPFETPVYQRLRP